MLMTLSGDSLYTHFLRQGGSSDLDNNSLLCAAEKANQFSCLSLWEELLAYFISTLLALLRKISKVRRRLNYLILKKEEEKEEEGGRGRWKVYLIFRIKICLAAGLSLRLSKKNVTERARKMAKS